MSGFQVGLGVLFAIVVGAVFCINKWQIYRLRSAMKSEPKQTSDISSVPVTPEDPIEEMSVSTDWEDDTMKHYSSVTTIPSPSEEEEVSLSRGLEGLNEQLDDMIWMSFEHPFTSEEVLTLYSHLYNRSPFARLLVWDPVAHVWLAAQNTTIPVYKLCCAVQLVSGEGMLERAVLEGIRRLCRNIVMEYRGDISEQSIEEVMHRAFLLDQFVSEMDIEIGLSVLAEHHFFPGTKLRSLAEAFGCRLCEAGYFQRMSMDGSHVLFTMKSVDAKPFHLDVMRMQSYQGISLSMDFPCTQDPLEAFSQMLTFARRLAISLGATIVDDHGDILKDSGFEAIRKSLVQLTKRMNQYQIPPGSALSFRIFRSLSHTVHSS